MTRLSSAAVTSERTRLLLIATAVGGAVLRLVQYFGGASLWLDELALARNIIGLPAGELLAGRLDFDQVAPLGFLLVERAIVAVLGGGELALRLFPLLCALASLELMRRVTTRVLDGAAAVAAMTLFACSMPLILQAAQVKQYSTDVAVTLLLVLLALERRSPVATAIAGTIAVWFSYPALLTAAGVVIARKGRRALVPWLLSGAAAAFVGLRSMVPETAAYMQQFWHGGFPGSAMDIPVWLWRQWSRFFAAESSYPFAPLFVVLMLAGLVVLVRRDRGNALLAMPFLVAIGAAVVHRYPLQGRQMLFLVPLMCMALGAVAGIATDRRVAGVLAVLLMAAPLYVVLRTPPVYRLQETRELLRRMQARSRPGDAVYVYYGGLQALAYYGGDVGLDAGHYYPGGCHHGHMRDFYREADRLRGRQRVWFVFVHALPALREQENLAQYLDTIGVRRETVVVPGWLPSNRGRDGVSALLYDLSDPARLARASAETAEVRAAAGYAPGWCAHGPLAPPRRLPPQVTR